MSHLAFGIQTKHFRGTVKPMVGRNVASIDTTIVVVPGLATANVGENHKLVVRVDQRILAKTVDESALEIPSVPAYVNPIPKHEEFLPALVKT